MPAVGNILGGRWRLERVAGTGSMGEMFEGRDLNSGQRVAVRVLRVSHANQRVRFEREARILAELDHPNIVRYIDYAVAVLGQPYLVMEWLDGEDLATRLRTRPLTVRETLAIGQDVAEAMAAAHARGIIHRELKPDNVFLAPGPLGPSKVQGFGIAQLRNGTPLTQPGAMRQTLGYMAPEQAHRLGNPTAAADVFSLGCVLFECLAGKPVFAGEHAMAVIDKKVADSVPSLTRLVPNVPMQLAALIERMLAKEPAQRLCDGRAVKAALVELAACGALDVEPETTLPRPPSASRPTTGTRRLLGQLTSCVGRDPELSSLVGQFADCAGESVAHAVLVTAPAGMGKSRLVAELMLLIKARHEGAVFWIGWGDPLRGGSAFGLLRQALQSALGLHDGAPLAVRQDTLRSRVARHVPQTEQTRVTEFLGELLHTPFPDDDSAPLRAARHEAAVMSEQVRRAAVDFLRAECAAHPVVLVLEDLHWGDLPTVRFVDTALRDLKEQPWMVVALARPEVHQLFPQLWAKRGAQEIRLHPLSRSASERLVRQVLGAEADPTTMARLVAQAEGNPFYLEELIRAVAERKDEALPETVVAMVHARLGRLLDHERQLLQAASVFGEVFWSDGVAALLGVALPAPAIHARLETLVDRELLVRRPDSRFPGMEELAFCHALLREGAYAMLTETDRILGHRLAAEWLERQGESEPIVLAQHYDRGREPARAGRFYFQAAARAVQAGDLEAAIDRARRALAHGLRDAERSVLFAVLAEVHCLRGEWEDAARWGEEGVRLAAPGSHPWALAMSAKMAIALREGKIDTLTELFHVLNTVEPGRDAVIAVVSAINFGCFFLSSVGRFALVERSVQRIAALVEPIAVREPVARGWMHMSHVSIEPWAHEDPWAGLQHAEASLESFREANHRTNARLAQLMMGMNLWLLGALERAERELRSVVEDGAFYGPSASRHLSCFVGTLADRGALDEAHEVASRMIEAWQAQGLQVQESQGRAILAYVLFRWGKFAAAEREARAALERLRFMSMDKLAAMATLAATLIAQDRAAEGLAVAEAAMTHYEALGAFGFRGAFTRLVHAEALEAAGDHAGACRALSTARERLRIQAARIGDLAVRRGFLENLPENARILALARQWLGEEDEG